MRYLLMLHTQLVKIKRYDFQYLELRFESRAVQVTGCLMGMLSMVCTA